MQEKLRRGGIRSIDAIVDITNFLLLEYGQPMHAFDLATLEGELVVRRARADEPMTLLDGNEVKLKETTLVIADAKGPACMAGIFGGDRTGVSRDHHRHSAGVRLLRAALHHGSCPCLRSGSPTLPIASSAGLIHNCQEKPR
ncbi:phenylalanine--tRNA ligase beta subunit-related protein [Escherichia coli]